MSLITNNAADAVCEGCLSVDRKLTPLLEEDSNFLFTQILYPVSSINHHPLLCWECSALLHKFAKFKKQVKAAHENLIRYMLRETLQLHTLSNLAYNKSECLKYELILFESRESPDTFENGINETRNTFDELIETKNSASESIKNIEIVESQNGLASGIKTNFRFCYDMKRNTSGTFTRNKVNETLPLAFVKIEENESDFDTCDDLNNGLDEKDDIIIRADDSNYLKRVIKPIPCDIPVGDHSKFKKKSRKKTTITDFDESDDEPLNIKKSKAVEDLLIAPKTKKTKDDKKIDQRKKSRRKRERPSGVIHNARVVKKLEELNMGSEQLEMVVLSWEEVEAEREQALNSVAFTRHDYRCYDCVLGFNHKFKLENHMKKHDPSCGTAVCKTCRVVCRDAHALCAHRRRHRVRWRCCACGETWSRAAVAADHVARVHHAPPPTHTCGVCGHTAPTLGKLRNHLKTHGERQKCELCGKTFSDRTSLRTHLFIHRGEKEYSCPRCDKKFLFKKAMQVHLVTHDAPAQLYCHQCDMNFKNQMSYYQHMKYNLKHIDPAKLKYACQLCDKRFVKAMRLEEHNVAVHLKVTPIKCTVPDCHFACSSRPVLRSHVRMVHRNVRARRNHICDACGKAYTTKKSLEGHMRSHTGERPFRCARCPSAFGYEAALYNHNKLVHLKAKTNRSRRSTQGALVPTGPTPPVPTQWGAPPTVTNTTAIS